MEKTKNYDEFKLREDNRASIDWRHVEKIAASIKERNLLHLRPIQVNARMEVIDGQHRLLAAKRLNVEIYYEVKKELEDDDIIILNNSKSWCMFDYLNYYSRKNENYRKMKEFIEKYDLKITVALKLFSTRDRHTYAAFKRGEFNYNQRFMHAEMNNCLETIHYIKTHLGNTSFLKASKFWMPLISLVSHKEFDMDKWMNNLQRMVQRIGPRVSQRDYRIMIFDIYNWRNVNKLKIDQEDEVENEG